MGPLDRFSAWLDSHRGAEENSADKNPVNPDRLRLMLSYGDRSLGFVIGRSGRSGEAPPVASAAEEVFRPDPEAADAGLAPEPGQAGPGTPETGPGTPEAGLGPQDLVGSFWDALDPTEREALRSVASWRTFAARARLMEEGERADCVMVILGGRVKIYVDDRGHQQVLAVRGRGQLVGERAAVRVSVRSANVVALEMIWALVIQTKDFAAFLSANPRVLDLVQGQLYQWNAEQRAGHRNGHDPSGSQAGTAHGLAADGLAAADQPDRANSAGRSQHRPSPLTGENCTVIVTDVVEFGARTRTDNDRLLIRKMLYRVTQAILRDIPDARAGDLGDGFLTVVPPSVSTAKVIDRLLEELPAALERHNGIQRESAHVKLRLALNVGPVVSDTGVSGEAIIVAARLVAAPYFKEAMLGSTAILGVIASPFVYETTIRHGADRQDLANYLEVPVEVKESHTTAWMKLYGEQKSPPVTSLYLLTRALTA